MRLLASLLVVVACSGSDDPSTPKTTPDDTDTTTTVDTQIVDSASETADTGSTATETCPNSVLGRFPTNGSTDAFYYTLVEFSLLATDATASITVEGPDGPVAGTSEVLGKRVRWSPTDALATSTSYTATMEWACAPESTTFITSATGDPVGIGDVSDKAYRLHLQAGRWIQPAGIGSAIAGLLGADILIGVDTPSANELSLTFARSDGFGGPQDLCEPTTPFPAADFNSNPLFVVGPADVALEIAGQSMPVFGLELSGAFTAGGASIEGGRLAGLIDTAPLVPVTTGGSDPFELCVLLNPLVTCLACPNGGTATCVAIEVDTIIGAIEPGGVVTRTGVDIRADPSCP